MSHFTVLVIGKNPEKQLEPFCENEEVPEYLVGKVTKKNLTNSESIILQKELKIILTVKLEEDIILLIEAKMHH